MKRIAILLHEHLRPRRPHFLIHAISEEWRKHGLDVSFVYGIGARPDADLLINHVDLTHTPPEYVDYLRSFPAVVNRDLVDISKRRVSTHLLCGNEDYGGPVIVKTDNNSGGGHEYRVSVHEHPIRARLAWKLTPLAESLLGRPLAWRSRMRSYPVYQSLAQVPRGVFQNRALVVERFLPEREGDRYFMRHYLCLGDHTRSVRVAGWTPFLKRSSCVCVDERLAVPKQVLALRREFAVDYGKIDYVMHDGEVVILDVNRTPYQPAMPEVTARAVGELAGGIWSLLPS